MESHASVDYEVRQYEDEDESRVVDLLRATRGGGPSPPPTAEVFRWKHLENPFGRSLMLLAETDGAIVGLRAFMRWEFRVGGRTVRAAQAVDAATHPDHQRRGVFSHLTRTALGMLRADTDLVYNTPNDKSLPGNLKIGWRTVGKFPVSIRVRRPIRFAKGFRRVERGAVAGQVPPYVRADPARKVLAEADLESLLGGAEPDAQRITTERGVGYLLWRYAAVPHLDYRVVCHERRDQLQGIAIFRVRRRGTLWESAVVELVAPRDDERTARSLLRQVAQACEVDHLTCHFPVGSTGARAAARLGFLRSPVGITVIVNPLRPELRPDPTAMGSWGFCLGDLEVF